MDLFSAPDYDGHEAVHFFHDAASGLEAIIAVHKRRNGIAGGGTRMMSYRSEQAALADALRLSRGMTYKHVLCGSPMGGGKIVVLGDPESDKTDAMFVALGRIIESFGGGYITGEDVGTTPHDMAVIRSQTRWVVGVEGAGGDVSPATAYGVFLGIAAAVRHRLGRDGLDGVRVAIQGVGNVGGALARRLAEAGASLVVADTDAGALERAQAELGAIPVAPEEILSADADVLSPCALGGVLDDRTIPRIRAPIVAGAANNQLADDRHGALLASRGILYAPDYVINAGGVLHALVELEGFERARVFRKVEAIRDTLDEIFTRAEETGRPTSEVADALARERMAAEDAASA
jgi:leucine dehydrogenase